MAKEVFGTDGESDIWNDPSAQAWAQSVLADMVPKLEESAVSISIAPTKGGRPDVGDVKYWVELGASIMMEKPLVVVVFGSVPIPERLRLVADAVVELDEDLPPDSAQKLMDAVKPFLGLGEDPV